MEHLIALLTRYGYFILFPLAIVEGPILSVLAGLLCVANVLNPFVVVPVIVAGDVIGDSFYYGLGRWCRTKVPPRTLQRFVPSAERVARVRTYFDSNPIKTISLSKIILGVGIAGLYIAGNASVPYKKFLLICLGTSFCQCTGYVIIGLLFGTAYVQIGSLLNGFATFTILAAVATALFFFLKSMLKKL